VAVFTLTSFNARWGLDVADRPFDLHATCRRFDTDVIAVQEVWNPHDGCAGVRVIAADLGYEVHEVALAGSSIRERPEISRDPAMTDGSWGIALLSRRPIRSVRTVDLGRLIHRWDPASRLALVAELDIDGAAVTVAVVHLSYVLPNAVAQLRHMRSFLPTGRPSIVAGDCNLWGPVASAAMAGWRQAVRGRTWPAARPHSQLDHIFVSPDIAVVRSTVLPPAGSDHRPIQAELRLPDASSFGD
jgi:endonuclease/exonuclease/phosphatase family metal-dependent hydrolase